MKNVTLLISSENADAIADANVECWWKGIVESGQELVPVATAAMFNEARVGRRQGEVGHVSFEFQNKAYYIESDGHVKPEYPKGLFDLNGKQFFMLMSGRSRNEAERQSTN